MNKTPTIRLSNGVELPLLGLGVYLSSPKDTANAVQSAVASGYRLIDTAAAYGNEREVGEGIARGAVPRDELFVTTKLWISDYGYDAALRAFDVSVNKLGVEYLDLYLLHWPVPSSWNETIAAWQAAKKLLADGRVRAIGVCNFTEPRLTALIAATGVTPAVNQVELHPYFAQRSLREVHARLGIATQAWSPIGGIFTNHPRDPERITRLLDDRVLTEIAARTGKTPAQVVLRWHIQNGVSAIPKSIHPERIASNIDIFDFELSETDMASIATLDTNRRNGPDPEAFDLAFLEART
ncbi:MAG: aldo/keto reductase [Nitrospiraceae bacterium]